MKHRTIITAFGIFIALCSPGFAQPSLNAHADNGLERECEEVNRFSLTRLTDEEMHERLIRQGYLVEIRPQGRGYYLDSRIGVHSDRKITKKGKWVIDRRHRRLYRHTRAYTRRFISRLAEQYNTRFKRSFMIGSLSRNCWYQGRVAQNNNNAASCEETSHTTGATVDLNYRTMTPTGRKWVEAVLLDLERRNLVQATKEHGQPVYHVMVYPTYMNWNPPVTQTVRKKR